MLFPVLDGSVLHNMTYEQPPVNYSKYMYIIYFIKFNIHPNSPASHPDYNAMPELDWID